MQNGSQETNGRKDRVAVVGAGLMGSGIAAVCALAGIPTVVIDIDGARLDRLPGHVESVRRECSAAGLASHRVAGTPVSLSTSADLAAIAGATIVFEAVFEDLAIKHQLFEEIERIVAPSALLASTTSTMLPTTLAGKMAHPERFLVAHFWNPPHALDLVEIAVGDRTADGVGERMAEFLTGIGQRPMRVAREITGFIGNRLQFALLREALYLVQNGFATPEEVDDVMRNTLGPRYTRTGPLETADLGKISTFAAIARNLFPTLADGSDTIDLLDELVRDGRLGATSGSGFYEWDDLKMKQSVWQRNTALFQNRRRNETVPS